MMRQVVLDTETTGLEVGKGHRLIEIGCIELARTASDAAHASIAISIRSAAIDEGARAVTGISDEFLLDKPLFAQIADELLDFIGDAELIIHNAAFDLAFLDAELASPTCATAASASHAQVLDTLALAREKYPGQKNSLDALVQAPGRRQYPSRTAWRVARRRIAGRCLSGDDRGAGRSGACRRAVAARADSQRSAADVRAPHCRCSPRRRRGTRRACSRGWPQSTRPARDDAAGGCD